ncbi:hypothetical protein I5M32_10805 [Pedobacter sp. SD-b]|uniref:Uncharacterized protein n=1 Tax=Pedobacter segetis TaxID=2793069 RepID=A0ABS1BKM9_9SPHI|nr:hypothetical protein [Pedobacter segetis]MBK0383450.1 hypothetical protein [Pedobacter segetis]
MKTPKAKAKSTKKEIKKVKSNIEIDLSKKIKDFIVSLGHDAEDIGGEIKKASKIITKKLSKKATGVKNSIKDKFKKADKKVVKDKKEVKKVVKKEIAKAKKEVDKTVNKAIKKAAEVKNVTTEKVNSVSKLNPVAQTASKIDKTTAAKPVVKRRATTTTSSTSKTVAKKTPAASTRKTAASKPTAKPRVSEQKKTIKNDEGVNQNSHPETPQAVNGRKKTSAAPKSDTKPSNTDLPTQAGPQNKYKRG